jgi:hypothetical protein
VTAVTLMEATPPYTRWRSRAGILVEERGHCFEGGRRKIATYRVDTGAWYGMLPLDRLIKVSDGE